MMIIGANMRVVLRGPGKVVVSRNGRLAVVRQPLVFHPIHIHTQLSAVSPHGNEVMPLAIAEFFVISIRIVLVAVVINEESCISTTIISEHHLVPYAAARIPTLGKDEVITARVGGFCPHRNGEVICAEIKDWRITTIHIIIVTIEIQCATELSLHPGWPSIEGAVDAVATDIGGHSASAFIQWPVSNQSLAKIRLCRGCHQPQQQNKRYQTAEFCRHADSPSTEFVKDRYIHKHCRVALLIAFERQVEDFVAQTATAMSCRLCSCRYHSTHSYQAYR